MPLSAPKAAGSLFSEHFRDSAGIVVVTLALLVYGVLQERIMTVGFGPERAELFEFSIFLVLCNRLCTSIMAFIYVALTEPNISPAAPIRSYAAVSFTNVVATSCQYEALKYVSFAVQTLAKSAKAMPVMLWGTVYSGKRYRAVDYVHACVITLGCTLFILAGDTSSRVVKEKDDWVYHAVGAALMLCYLAVDALTSTWQDNMFRQYNMGICDQVLYTTIFSTGLSFTAAVASGQLVPSIVFVVRHPEATWWILALSVASAVVQLVISFTIKRFGAVVFATIMTTRQFFSVLMSCLVFQTPLASGQWAGVAIVFLALYYKVLAGMGSKRPDKHKAADKVLAHTSPHQLGKAAEAGEAAA